MLQVTFHIESVLLIEVRQFFVSLMLGNVEFIAQEYQDRLYFLLTVGDMSEYPFFDYSF